jgi:3-oxoacyl-[acyl-carrier protein] reductase
MRFKDRVVIVTGGSRGIGRAISKAFATEGAHVIVNYFSDEEAAQSLTEEIKSGGHSITALKGDVSSTSQVNKMLQEVVQKHERIDTLVNNAGIIRDKLLMIMPEEDWDRVIEVSLKGAFVWSKAVLKTMIGQRKGRIINIVSPSAITGRAGQANYAAAKGGLISFTKTLSKELARFEITVNAVSPGIIKTDLVEKLEPELKEDFLKLIPMKRLGSPEDVAEAVLFLSSDAASYITGQVLCVDGGLI